MNETAVFCSHHYLAFCDFRDVVYEFLSSTTGRCCASQLCHHMGTFLQSPVDFWRTRGGHQNSRRGRVPNRNNGASNNHCILNKNNSALENSILNDEGPHSTIGTTITNAGDAKFEAIQLPEIKHEINGENPSGKKDQGQPMLGECNIDTRQGLNTSQLTVTSTKNGEYKTLTVPNDTNTVTDGALSNNTCGSLV